MSLGNNLTDVPVRPFILHHLLTVALWVKMCKYKAFKQLRILSPENKTKVPRFLSS